MTARIQLQDAADERSIDLAAEHLTTHAHADGCDVRDREFAAQQLADVDLHALNCAAKGESLQTLETRDAR